MVSRRSGMIAVMLHAGGGGDLAVIHHVGMRHAIGRRRAMTEGEHGRRRHEAKRREGRKHNRKPEAEPGSERGQHGFSIDPPMPTVGPSDPAATLVATGLKKAQFQRSSLLNGGLHAHRFMGFIHMLHTSRHITFLHLRFRHVEMHCRLFLLSGIGHLGDHFIHLLHMGVVAQVLAGGIRGGQGCGGDKSRQKRCFEHSGLLQGLDHLQDSGTHAEEKSSPHQKAFFRQKRGFSIDPVPLVKK